MARRRLFIRSSGMRMRRPGSIRSVLDKVPQPIRAAGSAAIQSYLINKGVSPKVVSMVAEVIKTGGLSTALAKVAPGKVGDRRLLRGTVMYGQGISRSRTYFGRVPKLRFQGTPSKNFYINKQNQAGVLTGTGYGKQSVFMMPGVFLSSDINTVADQTSADSNYDQWKVEPLSADVTLLLQNTEVGNCTAIIYELVSRVDHDKDPGVAWEEGAQDINTTLSNQDFGTKPYAIPRFNTKWRVFKETRVDLQPGKTHEHVARYGGFRPVSQTKTSDSTYLKGTSIFIMIVLMGTPVYDGSAVSTGQPTCLYTWTRISKAKIQTNFSPVYQENQDVFGNINPANVKIREEDGDLKSGDQQWNSTT